MKPKEIKLVRLKFDSSENVVSSLAIEWGKGKNSDIVGEKFLHFLSM